MLHFAGLPFSLQLILVDSEPRVWDLLAAAGKTSPPADALPAAEAAPADSPHLPSFGFGFFPRQATGELLQGAAQRHDGVHEGSTGVCNCVKSLVKYNKPEMGFICKHSRRLLQFIQGKTTYPACLGENISAYLPPESAHLSTESILHTIPALRACAHPRSLTVRSFEDLTVYVADGQTGLAADVRVYLISQASPRRVQLLQNNCVKYRFTFQVCLLCST